jgi:hypothetical protein
LVRQSKHNAIAAKLIVELACITQAVPVPFLLLTKKDSLSFATPAAKLYAAFISSWVGEINAAVMLW